MNDTSWVYFKKNRKLQIYLARLQVQEELFLKLDLAFALFDKIFLL